MDDAIAPATISIIASKNPPSTVSVTTFKSPPVAVSVTTSKSSSAMVSIMTSKSPSFTVPVMTLKSSSSATSVTTSKSSSDDAEEQYVLAYANGKAALHHVLSEVLGQPWWLLAKALGRSGFNEIQDMLLMNQAKRDTITFLNANGVLVTPLPQAKKNKLLDVKLFGSYCERIGKPIIDWTKVSKADFNSVALYMEEEKVTIPHHTMESHVNTIQPRKVNSTTTVMPTHTVIKPRNVTNTTTVTPTPAIGLMSAHPNVEVTNDPGIKVVDSSLIN